MALERTLSIIKPDATRRNLTGKINAKFEELESHYKTVIQDYKSKHQQMIEELE